MIKYFSFILVFVLALSFTSALTATQDSLDVTVIPDFNQPGKTTLTITDAVEGNYNIYTLTSVKLLPEEGFYLNSGKNTLEVSILPRDDLEPFGTVYYNFGYVIRNKDNKQDFSYKMAVRVVAVEDALEISSDTNSPDSESITFYVRNREDIDLENVNMEFSSIFFDFEETFNIKANEKKEFTVKPKTDIKKVEAGSYLVKAIVNTDRGEKEMEGRIFLGEKKGVEVKEETSGIFVKTTETSRVNFGNVYETVSIEVEKSILSRLFTSFSIEPDTVNRDGFTIYYSWERTLGPAESFDVKVSTNYVYPILIIVAIILIILGFKRFTETKIEIRKSVMPVKTKDGRFALRVRLNILARKRVENVSLVDRVPAIVDIHEKFDNVFKPSKIDTKNRRLQWDLGELNPGDERTFSYVIYSKVGVVGKFGLPRALAVFEKNGEIHEVESNTVYFLAEQQARD